MSVLRNISSGLRALFRKEQVSQELDEELNSFLEMATEEKLKQGMSPKDALRIPLFVLSTKMLSSNSANGHRGNL
jgi:hypothetical protein